MPLQYGGRQQSKWLHYLKIYVQIWKVCKEKIVSWVLGADWKIRSSRSQSGTTSLVMPDCDPRDGFFYIPLTPMIDPYNLDL